MRTLKKVKHTTRAAWECSAHVCRSPQFAIAITPRLVAREGGILPKQSTKRKSAEAQKHGEKWHDPGPTRKHAERIYIKYPLLPITEIANILGVSRQVIHAYIKELTKERERAREEAIASLKREEGL
jgi:DNA invertase Pin-like site-specific DNA recombinase